MTGTAYVISRTLEDKIAIAENNNQNTMLVTLGVLKEILALLKEQPEIVHCEECDKYDQETGRCANKTVHGNAKIWFCADGKWR